ncbi:MAG: YbfB/YjiJ family MFS transporter [Firmicutes bacterium]|nr:YbfB/YjiJ family MFS transporter [Bacillota bacterium]
MRDMQFFTEKNNMRKDRTVSSLTLIPAGLAIVAVTYGFARYAYGLFLPDIQSDLGLSTQVMGLIASSSCVGYLAATLLGSVISGVVGPRLPVVLGGLAAAGGMSIMAFSQGPLELAIGVILAGASPGLAYPPLSDAIMRLIVEPKQNRTYAVINSGTSFGVMISGPAALLAGTEWRFAWMGFAVIAVVATAWIAVLMPTGRYKSNDYIEMPKVSWRWLVGTKSTRLFIAATLFGVFTAVYWTFAVDLLVSAGGLPKAWSQLFWIVIGASGLLGGVAGDLVRQFGLMRIFRGAVVIMALAMAVLAVKPGALFTAMLSAMAFGGSFILIAGLFGIWSVNVFNERPSAGFGATFFLISVGQLVGPTLAGLIAGRHGLVPVFFLASVLTLSISFLSPYRDIHSMVQTHTTDTEKTEAF